MSRRAVAFARTVVTEPDRRRRLHESVARTMIHNDEVLGRWAGVMLNTNLYAELVDRHVDLASDLARLGTTAPVFDVEPVLYATGRVSRLLTSLPPRPGCGRGGRG
jgi:hypothetical protein